MDGIQLPTLKFRVTGEIVTDKVSVVCNLEFGVPQLTCLCSYRNVQ